MPTGEHFGTNVPQTFITVPASASTTTGITVNSFTSWPATPFTAAFGLGTSLQEAIYVTSVTGNTINTCTRGYDGTIAQNQPVNQTLTHVDIGKHFNEFRAHIDSAGPLDGQSEAVHGLTNTAGNVVMGTKEVQTVTNKTLSNPTMSGTVAGPATYTSATLSSPTINTPTLVGSGGTLTLPAGPDTLVGRATTDTLLNKTLTSPTINAATFAGTNAMGSGQWSGTGNFSEASVSATGLTGATNNPFRLVGQTTSGPPTSGTFVAGDVVSDGTYGGFWMCTVGGSPGTWVMMSGKYLISSQLTGGTGTINFNSIPQIFTHLRIEYVAKTTNVAGTGIDNLLFTINGAAANYDYQYFGWNQGNTAFSNAAAAQAAIVCGVVWTSQHATQGAGYGWIEIPFYRNTAFVKQILFGSSAADSGTLATVMTGSGAAGNSSNLAAVSSAALSVAAGNFATNSTFNLYGVV